MNNIEDNLICDQNIEDFMPKQHISATRSILLTITLFVTCMLFFACLYPYSITLKGNVEIIQEKNAYYAYVHLPPEGTGEIIKDMQVYIYITNYSEHEYGCLKGKVTTFALNGQIGEDGMYVVKSYIGKTLSTSYGKRLSGNIQLLGRAEIVIKQKKLIELLIDPINKFIKNAKE